MRDYGFSLTHILPYKDRIVDSVLIGRMRVSENSYSRIFYAVLRKHFGESCTFQIIGKVKATQRNTIQIHLTFYKVTEKNNTNVFQLLKIYAPFTQESHFPASIYLFKVKH